MKKILFFLIIIPLFATSQKKTINLNSESGIDQNSFYIVAGEPFVTVRYTKIVEGTPYFKEQWLPGLLFSSIESKAYKIEKVKLDLITNEVFFIDKDGKQKIATVDFKEIRLYDSLTSTSFKLNKRVVYNSDASKKNFGIWNWFRVM